MNAKVKNEQAGDIRHNMRENSRTVNATDQPYSENINTINREYPLCVTKFEEFLDNQYELKKKKSCFFCLLNLQTQKNWCYEEVYLGSYKIESYGNKNSTQMSSWIPSCILKSSCDRLYSYQKILKVSLLFSS